MKYVNKPVPAVETAAKTEQKQQMGEQKLLSLR